MLSYNQYKILGVKCKSPNEENKSHDSQLTSNNYMSYIRVHNSVVKKKTQKKNPGDRKMAM